MKTYSQHIAALDSAMQDAVAAQLDAHRDEIIRLFPPYVRPLLSLSWWAAKRIAVIIAPALVQVVLAKLASMTIAEIIEFYSDNLKAKGGEPRQS